MGLVVEALQPARVQRRRERQHFQRHAPPQRELLRLVDHPHPAAADLPEDPEVAQRDARLEGRGGGRTGGGHFLTGRGQARERLLDELQAVQATGQGQGDLGMAGQELLAIGPPPGLQLRQVLLQRRRHARIF
jgi:hypothetical protein